MLAPKLVSTLRLALVGLGAAAALGSTSRPQAQYGPTGAVEQPPAPRAMSTEQALGLWKSSFGPVKIELDDRGKSQIMGVWLYEREAEEIIGFFSGRLVGNVLHFNWREPAQPRELSGGGYLVFEASGERFRGRWWTAARDRGGDWDGWRLDNRGTDPSIGSEEEPYDVDPEPLEPDDESEPGSVPPLPDGADDSGA